MQLSELIGRQHTAVVLSDMQRGIIGDLTPQPADIVHARSHGMSAFTNDVLAAWQQS